MLEKPRLLARHELAHADGRRLLVYGQLGRGPAPSQPGQHPLPVPGTELRHDVLSDTWVAMSPSRQGRPRDEAGREQGRPRDEAGREQGRPRDEAGHGGTGGGCPFCPGGAELPFDYEAAVIENHYPALLARPPAVALDARRAASLGRGEVIVYQSAHEGSLATLGPDGLARLMAIWRDRCAELWADPRHAYVMVFENRGEEVGATLSHPHGQVYAFDRQPPLVGQRQAALRSHRAITGRCASCEVVAADDAEEARAVLSHPAFTVSVPFAARWPYEVHVRARRHGVGRLADLDAEEARALPALLSVVARRYDALWGFPLPYMMVALEAPRHQEDWHLAFEFYPPHRGPGEQKVRASVETATGLFINATLPEEAAARLATAGVHRYVGPADTTMHTSAGESSLPGLGSEPIPTLPQVPEVVAASRAGVGTGGDR